MTILGVNFLKINVEKKNAIKGKVNIANNVSIKNVQKADLNIGSTKKTSLNFEFEFTSKYEPDFAEMLFTGHLVWMGEEKQVKEIEKDWKNNKKIDKAIMAKIMNAILTKCNIEALIMSRELNLPPPIPLPKITEKQ